MKITSIPIVAALVAGSMLVTPTAEAQKTVKLYTQDLKAALVGKSGKSAIKTAGKIFKQAVNKQLTQKAPKLIQIANNQLAKLIKNNEQRSRAENFLKTVTSKKVFNALLTKRINQAVIKALQGIPTGGQSKKALKFTENRLFKAFKKSNSRTTAQYNKIIRNASRILKQPAPDPVSTF